MGREVRSRRSEESTGDGGWATGTLEQVSCCGAEEEAGGLGLEGQDGS